MERPELRVGMSTDDLRAYYYLKEELTGFCETLGISKGGGKDEMIERIVIFLDDGRIVAQTKTRRSNIVPKSVNDGIPENVVFSEGLREFFKQQLGNDFKFNVTFCKWLRENPGKTYADAIATFPGTLNEKKTIGKQFKYNTYIRDFFGDNPNMSLNDAIICWNAKKMTASQRYEKDDLKCLKDTPE